MGESVFTLGQGTGGGRQVCLGWNRVFRRILDSHMRELRWGGKGLHYPVIVSEECGMALSSQRQVGGMLLRVLTAVEDGVFGMVRKEERER